MRKRDELRTGLVDGGFLRSKAGSVAVAGYRLKLRNVPPQAGCTVARGVIPWACAPRFHFGMKRVAQRMVEAIVVGRGKHDAKVITVGPVAFGSQLGPN